MTANNPTPHEEEPSERRNLEHQYDKFSQNMRRSKISLIDHVAPTYYCEDPERLATLGGSILLTGFETSTGYPVALIRLTELTYDVKPPEFDAFRTYIHATYDVEPFKLTENTAPDALATSDDPEEVTTYRVAIQPPLDTSFYIEELDEYMITPDFYSHIDN